MIAIKKRRIKIQRLIYVNRPSPECSGILFIAGTMLLDSARSDKQ